LNMAHLEIVEKDAIHHIKNSPQMWGGNVAISNTSIVVPTLTADFIYEFSPKKYSEFLYTCINELISNCYDHAIRCGNMTYMRVNFITAENKVIVKNNGTGIDHNSIIVAFNRAFTGSRSTTEIKIDEISGHSGIGAKLTNIFAKHFVVTSIKNRVMARVDFKVNNTDGYTITKTSVKEEDSTMVEFIPDDEIITDTIENQEDIFRARCLHIKWYLPNINVFFNDIEIVEPDPNSIYKESFIGNYISDRQEYYLYINEEKLSYNKIPSKYAIVNGMDARELYKSSVFWNKIAAVIKKIMNSRDISSLINSLTDNIQTTKKDYKIFILMIFRIPNAKWTTNKKTNVSNPPDLEVIFNKKKFVYDIVENTKTWLSKITDKINKSSIEKIYAPPIGHARGMRTLVVTEGKSADSIIRSSINENKLTNVFGRLMMRGVPENILNSQNDCSNIVDGKFFRSDIMKAFKYATSLHINKRYSENEIKSLPFQRILIATDQDEDGDHIAGLFMLALYLTWPFLFDYGMIYKSSMPLVIAIHKKNNDVIFFSSVEEAREKLSTKTSDYNVRRFKGLGQYPKRWQLAMTKDDKFLIKITSDDKTFVSFTDLLGIGKNCAQRRRDIINNTTVYPRQSFFNYESLLVNKFLYHNMISFFRKCLNRHLPSVYDGLNDAQRRVLYVIYNYSTDTKCITVVGGDVKGRSGYEHGDDALHNVIIGMVRSYDGHCFMPLLRPKSAGFGTRNLSDDASQARYLECRVNDLIKLLFPEEDMAFLERDEYGVPLSYSSSIPFIMMNYNRQPAAGWSVDIIPRDFNVIYKILNKLLINKHESYEYIPPANDYTPLRTYQNFDDNTELIRGSYEIDNKSGVIKELAPYQYADNFVNSLKDKYKDVFTKINNISGSYNIEIIFDTSNKNEAKVILDKKLSKMYTPKLNCIINNKKATVKTFNNFYDLLLFWFENRKMLYEKIYLRNKAILELDIARQELIHKFVKNLPESRIMTDENLLHEFFINNKFPEISEKVYNKRYTYTDPNELINDWYNDESKSYDYITRKSIAEISRIKNDKTLSKLKQELDELNNDCKPFKYSKKWKNTIDKIYKIYKDNVKHNWIDKEDRDDSK
ncbi:MAG: ATP-binding protein, partial [Candidatus Riesia sp.]|nr:ATP-binding protein [Candidatus Riesia sp.]